MRALVVRERLGLGGLGFDPAGARVGDVAAAAFEQKISPAVSSAAANPRPEVPPCIRPDYVAPWFGADCFGT